MKQLFLVFLISCALYSASVFAQPSITLAVENSWPPYANQYGDGLSKQILQKAFANQGIQVSFVTVPYARALHLTEIGKVDGAFNVTKQTSTIEKFSFGQEPILVASASYYYPINSKFNYKSVADIPSGTTVAVILGYEYGNDYELNKHRFDEVKVSSQEQIIKLLLRNRADMAIMFDEVAKYHLTKMQLTEHAIIKGELNHTSHIFVAFNKDKALQTVIEKLDKGLKATRTLSK